MKRALSEEMYIVAQLCSKDVTGEALRFGGPRRFDPAQKGFLGQ